MFEIFQSEKNNKYYFNLKAGNGQVILSSQGYESLAGAENGVKSVMTNAADDSKFERKTAANGKFHFNLKAANGQIIGSSQMYASESGMENGIESVKKNAPDASVKELSGE
ncbi:YegP family protein [Robertkochia sediminum]|uniref:YegP family protein n=1 Tax=Robertkochia sediminum TaxID=2785326 RepID=UPI0019323B10|nr:YegP family protein [Robertkochia sediminum]MBL7473436.1 YegP family protein [Robertkochia sediminum]